MALHCPECGFVNPEGANYCQKCGAYLGRPEGDGRASTMTYKVDETGEYKPIDIEEEVDKAGAALVIRSGGGRAGESFTIDEERMSIGRTPDAARLPRRRHRLAQPRAARPPPGRPLHRRPRLAERHLRQPAPDRVAPARGRRRDPDRQVQAQLPGALRMAMAVAGTGRRPAGSRGASAVRRRRLAPAQGADDRRRREDPRARSSTTSRSPRSATSRTRSCSRRAAPPAATASTARPTSSGCARSCGCSATSSCRCG